LRRQEWPGHMHPRSNPLERFAQASPSPRRIAVPFITAVLIPGDPHMGGPGFKAHSSGSTSPGGKATATRGTICRICAKGFPQRPAVNPTSDREMGDIRHDPRQQSLTSGQIRTKVLDINARNPPRLRILRKIPESRPHTVESGFHRRRNGRKGCEFCVFAGHGGRKPRLPPSDGGAKVANSAYRVPSRRRRSVEFCVNPFVGLRILRAPDAKSLRALDQVGYKIW
jgi:hypothetical protein